MKTERPWLVAFICLILSGIIVYGAKSYYDDSDIHFLQIISQVQAGEAEQLPPRVISATGGITEIIYSLGAQSALVAVDTTSQYPEEALTLPNIGYMRAISSEGVVSLDPSVMLVTDDVGPPPAISLIKAAGVNITLINSEDSIEGLIARIEAVAEIVDKPTQAGALIDDLKQQQAGLFERRERYQTEVGVPSVLFLLSHAGHSPMAAGAGTAAHAIIDLAGGKNVIKDFEGYKPLTLEAFQVLKPDYILTTAEGLEAAGGSKVLLNKLGFSEADYGDKLIAMKANYLMNFGPRVLSAANELMDKLFAKSNMEGRSGHNES